MKNTHGDCYFWQSCRFQPAALLKLTLLHGCFLRFSNCTNGAKSPKLSHILEELANAHKEIEEVRQQIVILGERLMEEQDANKRTKELASSLERMFIFASYIVDSLNSY